MTWTDLDDFTRAYLECALWSSTDDEGSPLDDSAGIEDCSARLLEQATEDCRDFREANASDLDGIEDSQAGHDFWLTRNRHGAGFWDRGLGERGARLTEAAHVYGEVYLWTDDEGTVHSE